MIENGTLRGGTYLYGLYMGVPPPSRGGVYNVPSPILNLTLNPGFHIIASIVRKTWDDRGDHGNTRVVDSADRDDRSDCHGRIAQVLSQTIRAIGAIKNFLMETSDRGDPNITHSCRERHDSCHNVLKMAADNEFSLELFTAEVQIYDCLYNKFSKEYRDKYKGINCWKKIGGKFGLSPEEAEKQYKNIRTAYGRFLTRTSPSKSRKNDK